jgi:hypothetical protein
MFEGEGELVEVEATWKIWVKNDRRKCKWIYGRLWDRFGLRKCLVREG